MLTAGLIFPNAQMNAKAERKHITTNNLFSVLTFNQHFISSTIEQMLYPYLKQ
jgi:hypothetical protein